MDIKKALEKLKTYLPEWKFLDQLLLDAEALNNLSTIVQLQEEWVKHRASTLYIDPLLVELKVRVASTEALAHAFVRSWHPIATLDQLTPLRLKQGLDYWNQLLTLKERFGKEAPPEIFQLGALSINDLIEMKALSQEEFSQRLQALREELEIFEKEKGVFEQSEGVDYWKFVCRDTFSETVLRAYLTSFLVTEGYASLLIDPLEDEVHIASTALRISQAKGGHPHSIALPLSYEFWRSLQEARKS